METTVEFKFSAIDKTTFSDKAILCFSLPGSFDLETKERLALIKDGIKKTFESQGIHNEIILLASGVEFSIKEPEPNYSTGTSTGIMRLWYTLRLQFEEPLKLWISNAKKEFKEIFV